MKIGFIGAGAVGTAMGVFFHNKNVLISGFYSLHYEHACAAAQLINAVAHKSIHTLIQHADIIFVAVNDDKIKTVCEEINAIESLHHKIFVHTSGAEDSSVFSVLKHKGALIGSIHPLQSFAQLEKSVRDLENSYFSVEGDLPDAFWHWWNSLALHTVRLKANQKTRYHLAAVIVSNYFVSVISYGIRQMKVLGIDEHDAVQMLTPLVEGTFKNITAYGVTPSLTGPIVRGDIHTIEKHLNIQSEEDRELYSVLGREAVALALQKGLGLEVASDILELMKEGAIHGNYNN